MRIRSVSTAVTACLAVLAVPSSLVADQPLPASKQALEQSALAAGAVGLPEAVSHALTGKVTAQAIPLAQARVYAYEMNDLSLRRVDTNGIGSFLFEELPAGLYKIITVKPGFVPAIVMLQRRTAQTSQYLEVDLAPQDAAAASDDRSFWNLRKKIPSDVLRDLETLEMAEASGQIDPGFSLAETRFQAMTGTDDAVGGSGQMNRGTLGMKGSVGRNEFDLTGDHWVARGANPEADPSHSNQLSLSVRSPEGANVRMVGSDNRLDQDGVGSPVDLQRYQVSWSQRLGPGSSEVRAEVVDENNFFASGPMQPAGLPAGSRTLNLEGSYEGVKVGANSLSAGFKYRQVQGDEGSLASLMPSQRVDLFGNGQLTLRPRFFVQYGLYSTLRDGSLSLTPQGGVVVDLGSNWTAATLASRKVHEDDPTLFDFVPLQYTSAGSCQAEQYCYQLQISRALRNDGHLSIGATHRKFDETLRLYFSDDFFSHFESLYLVDGDRLPEIQVAMSHRLSPSIITRLESSLASGGGGVFYASDANSYEHSVRYLVTSLDTRFEQTATGLYLAFHHLEQQFLPITDYTVVGLEGTDLETQRLQLMLTQDLSPLNLASLALRLNMEVSRGGETVLGDTSDDHLRKRVMGGVAVSF